MADNRYAVIHGNPLARAQVEGSSVVGENAAPTVQLTENFPIQSYFSSTLFERAVIAAQQGQPLIFSDSKKATKQISGYGFSVAPWSAAPLGIVASGGGQKNASSAYIVPPGAVFRPYGVIPGAQKNAFAAVQVGLPFGFGGGGRCTFKILQTPDADDTWPPVGSNDSGEVIVQRQRIQILDSGVALPALADAAGTWYNWPLGFPWANGRNDKSFPQIGVNLGQFHVTRVELRVRVAALTGGETFYAVARGTSALDTGSDGLTVATTDVSKLQTLSCSASAIAGSFPVLEVVGGPLCALGGDFCRVDLVSSSVSLIGQYVDVTRFGVIA